ncbi:siderophore-interacting protein [Paractinoplanes atraurantiacus]|uniref:RNA polymerase sigma-70 factor, ECF subfamily n=1 Tax=Paractinoplanes atraurantiacus TaxID=1036182 RepID=A0A285K8K5_9ACTN|nr:siderophore-interacting protein [Actinoplanes atraurantiacus]SNY68888.1 RNA polymerase sigma-70 factor, ECF subfamily [Actinoplanes atraurantiacus]
MRPPHDDVVREFLAACRTGEISALRAALHDDAVAMCDGGGAVLAALNPVRGAENVAGLVSVLLCRPGSELTVESVNGRTGLALRRGGRAEAVIAAESAGGLVSALWIVLTPAKLARWHVSTEHG